MDQMLGLSTGTFGYVIGYAFIFLCLIFAWNVRKMSVLQSKILFWVFVATFAGGAVWYRMSIWAM